jgi:hypothetical protein
MNERDESDKENMKTPDSVVAKKLVSLFNSNPGVKSVRTHRMAHLQVEM